MEKHGEHWALVKAGLLWLLLAAPAGAQCRLALLLAMDISSSVDEMEDRLQRGGLANALLSPEVVDAFLASPDAQVALAVFEWSGRYQQDLLVDWVLIDDEADLARVAASIRDSRRSYSEFPTALGYAMGYAAGILATAPPCDRQKIDVSGDGTNNDGFPPRLAYENFPLSDVTVNGLAIGTRDPSISSFSEAGQDTEVVRYYREELIRGPDAFVEIATDYRDFERAMRRKLLRELQGPVIGHSGPERSGAGG